MLAKSLGRAVDVAGLQACVVAGPVRDRADRGNRGRVDDAADAVLLGRGEHRRRAERVETCGADRIPLAGVGETAARSHRIGRMSISAATATDRPVERAVRLRQDVGGDDGVPRAAGAPNEARAEKTATARDQNATHVPPST
jgi:hypothetical protein